MIGFTPRILRAFWTDFWTVMTTGFDPGLEVNVCVFTCCCGNIFKVKKINSYDFQALFYLREQRSFTHKSH